MEAGAWSGGGGGGGGASKSTKTGLHADFPPAVQCQDILCIPLRMFCCRECVDWQSRPHIRFSLNKDRYRVMTARPEFSEGGGCW